MSNISIIYQGVLWDWRVRAINNLTDTHPAITCSKLTIEALEQGVKYVQS